MSAQEESPAGSNSHRVLRIVRILIPFYIGGLVISAPFVLALFGYGLAHAGEGAIVGLLLLLAGGFAIAALPPLALLSSSTAPIMGLLKFVGGAVMLFGVAGMAKLLHFWWLEPQWMKWRFRHAMEAVQVVSLEEQPIELDGRVIGLKLVREIELKRDVAMDKYGAQVVEVIREVYIDAVDRPQDSQSPFDGQSTSRLLSVDGHAVSGGADALGTIADTAAKSGELKAGRYRTEHVLLLWGLRGRLYPSNPCRDEAELARFASARELVSGYALEAKSVVRFSFDYRRGYDWYTVASLPVRYRYDHSSWMQGVRRLPIDTCQEREAREQQEKAAAQRAEREEWYARGDARLSHDDNPLVQEMCNHDVAAVRERLGRGVPKFNFSGTIHECTLDKPSVEMFALTMPALYARSEEREGYCSVLRSLHARRALPYLEAVAKAGLPILCSDDEQPPPEYRTRGCESDPAPFRCRARSGEGINAWRAGLYPLDGNGQTDVNQDPAARQDTVQWLHFLAGNNVPICATLPDKTNLLQEVVVRFPPDVVLYLAQLGCDAHAIPPMNVDPNAWPREFTDVSPAVHWLKRRHGIAANSDPMPSVDARQGEAVARAMGDLTAAEINFVSSEGVTLLHQLARYLPDRPDLFRYLLAHGARIDVADKSGVSWFSKGYAQLYGPGNSSLEQRSKLLALLDLLSIAQLRELIAPKNALTEEPGMAIEEYDLEPGELTMYLCKRKAKDCR